jgi:hypothetical protein
MTSENTVPPFDSDRHALYVGWVVGIAQKHGLRPYPVTDDDGNYTDRVVVRTPGGYDITVIVPPPPDDWDLTDDA